MAANGYANFARSICPNRHEADQSAVISLAEEVLRPNGGFLFGSPMAKSPELRTERLLLRRWLPSDREAFAAMNADPRVMEHFPATLSREECDNAVARIEDSFERQGFGWWAVEVIDGAPFIGFIGLSAVPFQAPFTPCIETGWRLAFDHWNRGYATEGARAALTFGFDQLQLNEIVAFTVPANVRSRRVMEKLGMTHNPADDFEHPNLPEGHPLRRHVLYRRRP
jgi:RimJ/RimL family protein N-acetyltransferase